MKMEISSNYEKFKLLSFNRPISKKAVKVLKESISKIGYVPSKEILVSKDFYIIDGQHRFTACKEMELPIQYVFYEGLLPIVDIVQLCNIGQKNWDRFDYIEMHAKQGKNYYVQMLLFQEMYKFGASNTIVIVSNGRVDASSVRRGIEREPNIHRHKIANFINACSGLEYYRSKNFIVAVTRLFNKASEKQISAILDVSMTIKKQADTSNYVHIFENIINKRSKTKIVL
jgi:hypothetical protein